MVTHFPLDESKSLNLDQAAAAMRRGELVIYPTETFYALGCDARNPEAVARLLAVKGREPGKPLPLLAGNQEQVRAVTAPLQPGLLALLEAFWPGPLTICAPAASGLPEGLRSATGEVAVRVAGHAMARALALAVGGSLVSTSANLAGQPPASDPAVLDPTMVAKTAGVLLAGDRPAGGAPSSIVRMLDDTTLEMLREGAIPRGRLQALGWTVLPAGSRF